MSVVMLPKTIVHLLSGGLDSTVLLYDLHSQGHLIHCVFFNYGQKHLWKEYHWARTHCERLKLLHTFIEIPPLRGSTLTDGSGGVVVPNRNAVFLSIAVNLAVAAKADTVTIGVNQDDEAQFPDCRMAFIQMFNHMLIAAEIPVEVCAPYIDKKKWWISGYGREIGVSHVETWSCYRGGAEQCGECPACLKMKEAIKQ